VGQVMDIKTGLATKQALLLQLSCAPHPIPTPFFSTLCSIASVPPTASPATFQPCMHPLRFPGNTTHLHLPCITNPLSPIHPPSPSAQWTAARVRGGAQA
jgi:hypothetical protein